MTWHYPAYCYWHIGTHAVLPLSAALAAEWAAAGRIVFLGNYSEAVIVMGWRRALQREAA